MSSFWIRRTAQLSALAAALVFTLPQASASVLYQITVDTSSISGTNGAVDLQFNPGGVTSQAATAGVTGFTGGTLGAVIPPIIGPVTGSLPTDDLLFQNSANTDYANGVLFGSSFTFLLTLDGVALTAPNNGPAGTSFGLFVFDSAFNPLITADGLVARVDINPDGTITTTGFPDGGTTFLAGVPEPGALSLVGLGAAALCMLRKRLVRQ